MVIEPATNFEVQDLVQDRELEQGGYGYPDSAVFGLLDILMLAEGGAIREIRVILEKAEYIAVDSSPHASRQAGQDAGRKILEVLK